MSVCQSCKTKFTDLLNKKANLCKYCIAEDELEDNFEEELNSLLNPSGKTVVVDYEESQKTIDR